MLQDPFVRDPSTHQGKIFRRRFRVPFPAYEHLLGKALELGFQQLPVSAAGIEGVPLELQILRVLRVLGRGTCFDGIEELTGGSAECHRVFSHKFCELFARRY